MNIILLFLIGVSLSMDAFSLSLAYGTINLTTIEITKLSIIVGLYHFFMPILGMYFGNMVLSIIDLNQNLIVFIIFSFIGINMIFESFKKQESASRMKLYEMILFGFAVSIDSFSIGIGINKISSSSLMPSFIFSILSLFFTYIGLICGNKFNKLFGKLATLFGGLALIVIGIIYLI